jgi:hypothetical protein
MVGGNSADSLGHALAQRSIGATDPATIAAATMATLEVIASNLSPVIGARGFDALLGRSFYLSGIALPWQGDHWSTEHVASRSDLLTSLERRLAGGAASAAAEMSLAVFMNFSKTLVALIGASLADRLLSPVRAPTVQPLIGRPRHE